MVRTPVLVKWACRAAFSIGYPTFWVASVKRRGCLRPSDRWHFDEMVARIAGKRDVPVARRRSRGRGSRRVGSARRDERAALRLMRKLLRKIIGLCAQTTDDRQAGLLWIRFSAFVGPARMSGGYGRTIAPRTSPKSYDDKRDKCRGSSRVTLPTVF